MIRVGALTVFVLFAAAGCDRTEGAPAPLPRSERFGVLRHLEFFPRSSGLGGPFFLDRFEVTRGEWESWLDASGARFDAFEAYDGWNEYESNGDDLPVVGVDLAEARAFARWRFGRLPRYDEWLHAATGGGRYRFPWGDSELDAWANTQELGLAKLTPVGAFESGRPAAGPYDLVGNAGEWTETPDPRWLLINSRLRTLGDGAGDGDLGVRMAVLARHPALVGYRWVPAAPWPVALLIAANERTVPRITVSGYNRPMSSQTLPVGHFWAERWRFEVRAAADRSSVLGLRIATDPDTLLDLLTRDSSLLTDADAAELRAFLARVESRAALLETAARHADWLARPGAITALLRGELGA